VKGGIEAYASKKGYQVITPTIIEESKAASGGSYEETGDFQWTPEARQRLENIPGFIRPMARMEIERIARDKGLKTITDAIMDEVKEKFGQYMGMGY
jgi:hypothetical protein